MTNNLYDTLGVNENATREEIKQAYRDKAKENHPDKEGGDKDRMQALSHAYSVLGNEGKRKRYDETGEEKEVGFDVKFNSLVQDVFMKMIDREEDVDGTDFIGCFLEVIEGIIGENRKQVHLLKRKVVKLERVINRLGVKQGSDMIGGIVKNNLHNAKIEIKLVEENIEFFLKAQEVVGHHEYRVEVPGEEEGTQNGFKWISRA